MAKPEVFIAEYLVLLGRDTQAQNEFRKDKDYAMRCFGLNDDQRKHVLNDLPDALGAAIIAEFGQTLETPVVSSMTTKLTL
jgi:hypothetical protein